MVVLIELIVDVTGISLAIADSLGERDLDLKVPPSPAATS